MTHPEGNKAHAIAAETSELKNIKAERASDYRVTQTLDSLIDEQFERFPDKVRHPGANHGAVLPLELPEGRGKVTYWKKAKGNEIDVTAVVDGEEKHISYSYGERLPYSDDRALRFESAPHVPATWEDVALIDQVTSIAQDHESRPTSGDQQ